MMKLLVLSLMAASAQAGSIASVVAGNKDLSTLHSALDAAGLLSVLDGAGSFTLFAPSNDAFNSGAFQDAPWKVKYLLDPSHKASLQSLLKYHVVGKALHTADLSSGNPLDTLNKQQLHVDGSGADLEINDVTCSKAHITSKDVQASNGVVQIVDSVMVPTGAFCPDIVFVAEQREQGRITSYGYDCRNKETHNVSVGEMKPVGLTVDSEEKLLLWSNDYDYPHQANNSWITSMNFDGSNKKRSHRQVVDPQGLTVDPTTKTLYFTEHSGYKVSRSNYDGTDTQTIIEKRGDRGFQPADVAIDTVSKKLFVTAEKSPENVNGTLYMMDTDGKNIKVLKHPLTQNYGVCVDEVAQHVYAVEGGHGGHIDCIAYGKTPCKKDIVVDVLEYPYMCTVDNVYAKYGGPTRLIFTQANIPGQLYHVGTDGKNLTRMPLLSNAIAAPMGIELACSA